MIVFHGTSPASLRPPGGRPASTGAGAAMMYVHPGLQVRRRRRTMGGMAVTPGRAISIWSGTLALAIFGIAGFAFRQRIQEEYWLWRLERGSGHHREAAARALGEMRALRAVPALIEWWVSSSEAAEGSSGEPEFTLNAEGEKIFGIYNFGDGFCTHRECPY